MHLGFCKVRSGQRRPREELVCCSKDVSIKANGEVLSEGHERTMFAREEKGMAKANGGVKEKGRYPPKDIGKTQVTYKYEYLL